MERVTIDILHDEKDLLVRLKDFKKLGNVLLVEFLHDFHLSFD